MKKTLPLLFLSIFAFSSCDNELNSNKEQEGKKNPYKTETDLSSSTFVHWDNKGINDPYFMLGYGYDITGKFAHPLSIRNKVINVEKFDNNYDEATSFKSTSVGPELSLSGTQRECIETMGEKAGFSKNEILKYKNLFKGAFDSPFKNDSSFSELSYYYRGISQIYVVYYSHFLYMGQARDRERFQSQYLTDEFKTDIETISSEEIIKKYGTHILSGIKIGEKIDYLYRYAEDKNSSNYFWFLQNVHYYFSPGPSVLGSKPDEDSPLKENMYIEVVDGTRPNPNAWMVDITNFKGERIIFNGWDGISEANLTLVDFKSDDCLIPIYEFVKNSNKKEALIKAYEKYLSE